MSSKSNISVVIPTIGNRDLIPTINSLYSSSIKIDEIIISIPFDVDLDIEITEKFSNLIIYKSRYKGQVAQRIEGFKKSINDYVLQLDDDIILEKNCLELMYNFIKNNKSAAISAHFHHAVSKNSIYLKEDNLTFSNSFFLSELKYFSNYVYNKIKMGNSNNSIGFISKSGFETYPNFPDHKEAFISGWIPGGCVMHYKRNLVLSNFFSFV